MFKTSLFPRQNTSNFFSNKKGACLHKLLFHFITKNIIRFLLKDDVL